MVSKTRSLGMKRAHARPGMKAKWAAARARGQAKRRARLDPEILRMHADYEAGMSIAGVGRKYGRHRASVRELFSKRGLHIRPPTMKIPPKYPNGQIIPMKPATAAELAAMIARATKLAVPVELKLDWRKWSFEKRGAFIRRLRAKLNSPRDRPETPFSDNVEPFDYASPKAQTILSEMNEGLPSRLSAIKLDICSQGVIWRGQLWFWTAGTGYQLGPWNPVDGRPSLHRVLWEEAHGRELQPDEVLRFIDGNKNNLVSENLALATRNDVCRENHYTALTRKSREQTAILLQRSQKKGEPHASREILTALKQTKKTSR